MTTAPAPDQLRIPLADLDETHRSALAAAYADCRLTLPFEQAVRDPSIGRCLAIMAEIRLRKRKRRARQ